jgi:hypothetical protein
VAAVLALGLALSQGQAGAHVSGGGPYGSTTTTIGATGVVQPSCELLIASAAPGDNGSVRVGSAPRGSSIEIRFDGGVVAQAEATGPGSSPGVDVDVDFVVPTTASPGTHHVTAVGADFSVTCETSSGEEFAVLSATLTNDGGSGSLPKTGITVALLLVVAVALVIVGRAVLEASRHRARAARAHQHRISTRR